MPEKRIEIPQDVADRLLADNRHTCCICRINKNVIIHHIDSNPSNNNPENLCVLCVGCHSDVHSNHGLGRKFTPGEIKIYKEEWEDRCKVEDKKKTVINKYFNKYYILDPEAFRNFVLDVSSGATIPQINTSVEASASILLESTGDEALAEEFKRDLLQDEDDKIKQ